MPYSAVVYNVMLASPNDVSEEREIAREVILDWNNIHSATRQIVLLPISWEYNSVPSIGRPQEVIDKQVLENADLLIGIFWTRIGTPTGEAISGTVEEIEKHINSGKPAMLYFSNKPVVPDSIDQNQYSAVRHLKKEFQSRSLTSDFDSVEDFKNKFQRHLSLKLNEEVYRNNRFDNSEYRFKEGDIVTLSQNAEMLLTEAAKSASGQISKVGFKGGLSIETNGKEFNEDSNPRTSAMWEAVIDELLGNDLISDNGYKGEIFSLTQKGYELADKLATEGN